jgi:hypothetical protein
MSVAGLLLLQLAGGIGPLAGCAGGCAQGCGRSDAPPVRAVEVAPATPEQVAAKREAEELRASPRNLEVNYEKPPGVYVDAHFLGGRRLENVQDIVTDQLGLLQATVDGVEGRSVQTFERGTLTLEGGAISIIDVTLPEPVRRPEALVLCGFSGLADRYLSFTDEFRVVQYQGFRRVVLHREERNSEMIVRLTAYKRQNGPAGRSLQP